MQVQTSIALSKGQRIFCVCRYFIYLNWMPTYFSVIFGMDVKSSSYLSFLPWTVSSLWHRSPVILLCSVLSQPVIILLCKC